MWVKLWKALDLHLHGFTKAHRVSQKASLHDLLVSYDLIPQKPQPFNLVMLNTLGNVRVDVNQALLIGFRHVDDNSTSIFFPGVSRFG